MEGSGGKKSGFKVTLNSKSGESKEAKKSKKGKKDKDKKERRAAKKLAASEGKLSSQSVDRRTDGGGSSILEEQEEEYAPSFMHENLGMGPRDYSSLNLKQDHQNRPLWVCPDGRILLETFSPVYKQAYDFLIAIAEPQSRPEFLHEYSLSEHSLYAAVSVGLETETIISVLDRLSKVQLSRDIKSFIRNSTQNYGKVKLVLQHNRFYVESRCKKILDRLLQDSIVREAHMKSQSGGSFVVSKGLREKAAADIAEAAVEVEQEGEEGDNEKGGDEEAEQDKPQIMEAEKELMDSDVYSFEVDAAQVEHLKQRCLPGGLNYPMLEEYDFRNDSINPDLNVELKPVVQLRPYQEKSLNKMFGNGRARSGIIVLPCGAGKSLTGISAAVRVRKSCLCLCTSSVSVDQWRHQFKMWTTLQDNQVSRFTSDQKEFFTAVSGVTVTTYTMIAFSGKRSEQSERVMSEIKNREWGLLLLDEVHVVPAQMFRKVIGVIKAHCKLGLTATLLREDERIGDLNFLIGPKLYEANWLDLTREGHIANVQCAEIWCPMTKEFFREYLKEENSPKKQLLYVMNPTKFMACQFLISYHENRGDKVIVFSDNIFALRAYAMKLKKPFIYGPTSHAERTRILYAFKHDPNVNTVFLSKVGDNSLDIPEANVLIQISSHAGSRRQEAQRLGRILRAKKARAGFLKGENFNAFFYTLVSQDTQEMYYSAKRQQFLIDQGYSFKVITNLLDLSGSADLHYATTEDQMNLLAQVLSAGVDEAGEEVFEDADDISKSKAAARRAAGDMSALSGAQGRMYMEYSSGKGRGQKRGPAPKISAKNKKLRNMIFS
ncbi:hypothetical protein BSKO_00284 [Bryopsis sp. KO-2023]|nr:hypothetical protein BSKO_00284 [Bryopsis sp. KO-2023]